jgi:hypothetical protein
MARRKRQRAASSSSSDDDEVQVIKPRSPTPDDGIKDDKKWTHGEFEVITQDSVRFRVPKHLMEGHR